VDMQRHHHIELNALCMFKFTLAEADRRVSIAPSNPLAACEFTYGHEMTARVDFGSSSRCEIFVTRGDYLPPDSWGTLFWLRSPYFSSAN